jgi:hypothetical protein
MAMDAILTSLLSTGLGVDIALGFIALEFAYLFLRCPQDRRRHKALELFLALGAGVCLMLALRCALTGAPPIWIAVWLAASLPFHLADSIKRKL